MTYLKIGPVARRIRLNAAPKSQSQKKNVISYLNTFPKELNLDKQVDYDLQFSKSFLDPIKVIMDTIGWKSEKMATLEFLFG